ncbi:protein of unknown function DUF1249 [Shewanella denitrificans OS217]|uniref:Dehydrogenase n=1 Tax=Shewanella denitrificans (strain OS217 / ATCC BAA-1090 / DSM 15013) TaxID=318161 RepID=Q12J77_SHEDO|nr:DUF1249 domain-containing protein [Shewanella denitrificans]ABE56499.1 protein of unknown function DUF1249 [Shewanella denitrificans OS217]
MLEEGPCSLASLEFNKAKYQPNISAFLALCGRNYAYILKWLPNDSVNASWLVQGEFGILAVSVVENTKYTQLVEISRDVPQSFFLNPPKVLVRIYHDAQLAEVLTSRQICHLKPVYNYPNSDMHQIDEKYRINAFLEELLKIGCHPMGSMDLTQQ